MIKHHVTVYGKPNPIHDPTNENEKPVISWYACAWIQLDLFGKSFCFSIKEELIDVAT